jgi:uncharacterized protein
MLFLVFILVFKLLVGPTSGTSSGYYVRRNGQLVFVPYTGSSWSSGWGGGGGGGFSSGGGFSGGGGSSGGGGASGSW